MHVADMQGRTNEII